MPHHEPKILSIQSHVTHGYVGNKAATFPLLLHGFDVDAINTVSLSNHSGYPIIRGHRMDLQEYELILDGLRANAFLADYDYVLTGYINNVDIINHVEATVAEIRQLQREADKAPAVFFCDPVMGDNGKMYCKEGVIEAYRSLLPVADVLTPNYFEASILTGIPVKDLSSAIAAADWFHTMGVPNVVIKSFAVPGDEAHLQFLLSCMPSRATAELLDGEASDAAASRARQLPETPRRYTGLVPHYPGSYTGTGDIFAASLVAFRHKYPFPEAVGKAMGVLQDLLLATRAEGGVGDASLKARELHITRNPKGLLEPVTEVAVVPLEEFDKY